MNKGMHYIQKMDEKGEAWEANDCCKDHYDGLMVVRKGAIDAIKEWAHCIPAVSWPDAPCCTWAHKLRNLQLTEQAGLRIQIHYYFGELNPDPSPHWRQNSGVWEAQIELWNLTMKAFRLKMEPWRICRPVVADLTHYDEKQNTSGSALKWKAGSGSAMKWKAGSGSALKWSPTLRTSLQQNTSHAHIRSNLLRHVTLYH